MCSFRLFIIGLILWIGGCSLSSEYQRPHAPVPDVWPGGAAYPDSAGSAEPGKSAGIVWRDFIRDPRLQKVIETALENNRDLRIAALNVKKARALYGIQRAEILPVFTAAAGGSKERIPADLTGGEESVTSQEYHANLGVSAWEIDFFGRIRSLKDRALEAFLATEQARRSTQILVIAETAGAYLALAADRENLALAKKTFATQKDVYHLIEQRFDAGIATALDLYQAQMQMDIARRDIARYTQQAARDENALNLLVGASMPMESRTFAADLNEVSPFQEISPGLSSEVLLWRPDVMAAEHGLKAAHADIGAARAALFPRISLTAAGGSASSELSNLFGAGQESWRFAPQITLPVFDPRLWAALDATQAEREIALAQYEKAVQTAFREAADALAVQGTIDEEVAAQRSLAGAAEETLRLSHARYDRGIDSYLSVLDAQRSLYAARQALIALQLARRVNKVKLYAVLGGGAD